MNSKITFISILIIPFLLLSSINSNAAYTDDLLRKGIYAHQIGEKARAEDYFNQILKIDSNHILAHYQLGVLYAEDIHRHLEAEEAFLTVLSLGEESGESFVGEYIFRTYFNLGLLYVKDGKYSQGISKLKKVIELDPEFFDIDQVYNSLGVAYYHQRMYEEAILYLKEALKVNSDYLEARFNLRNINKRLEYYNTGTSYLRMGQPDEAIKELQKAIKIDPYYIASYYKLGNVYYLLGKYDETIKEYTKAIMLNPNYRKADVIHSDLGILYYDMKEYDKALAEFKRAIELNPENDKYQYQIGNAYLETGKYDAAITAFQKALSLKPHKRYFLELQSAIKIMQEAQSTTPLEPLTP